MARVKVSGRGSNSPALAVSNLQVYYGASHALQGVDLILDAGVHAVVGRNGMGKTTLCNAIMGLTPVRSGSIRVEGQEITGLKPHQITRLGLGYTPQGRRLWRSLSVNDHLKMCEVKNASWSIERIYDTFPRLAERKNNGGGQLSGGEQQMLAISRALLQDPRLLILDEPTEGLAPVIVAHVEELLHKLAESGDVSILLIEQNIGVAIRVADQVSVMVNGTITTQSEASVLGADRALQQRLLGVGRDDSENTVEVPHRPAVASTPAVVSTKSTTKATPDIANVADEEATADTAQDHTTEHTAKVKQTLSGYTPPTRWSRAHWQASAGSEPQTSDLSSESSSGTDRPATSSFSASTPRDVKPLFSTDAAGQVLVAGTFDTKSKELEFIARRLSERQIKAISIDLSTSGKPSSAHIPPHQVAAYHPGGAGAVFTDDRGRAVTAMATAFQHWIEAHPQVAGIISAGGSGGTALATPAMRAMPIGKPKVMISTVASGNVAPYVGPSDIMMMYSVTDVQGINSISSQVLGNGADALAGMLAPASDVSLADAKPAVGLTMFGLTTPAIQAITKQLNDDYECLVFHATGIGGQSMEKLAESNFLAAAIDITTTEVCDLMMGGVFACTEDRFDVFANTRIPYVGSVGALDMVNFGSPDSVPAKYKQRLFVEHNPQVTLMRTTPEENRMMGKWIGQKLNSMDGPVRFLLPEGGVSGIDAPGKPFHNPAATQALIETLEQTVDITSDRQLIRYAGHINDPEFAELAVKQFRSISNNTRTIPSASYSKKSIAREIPENESGPSANSRRWRWNRSVRKVRRGRRN